MHAELTVIVPTHNRAPQLEKCLEALLHQSVGEDRFAVLVVDNASHDDTPDLIARYQAGWPALTSIREEAVGHSHARNAGLHGCESEWVAYLDDDAIPHPDWAERLLSRIDEGQYDGVGGYYQPYFDGERPAWYLDQYNSNHWMLRDGSRSYLLGIDDPTLSGGNCAFKRKLLVELGGFNVDLGMKGDRVGYADEVELQNRMLAAGHRLFFDADISMDHYTPAYKQKLTWFATRSYCAGRDQAGADVIRYPGAARRFVHLFVWGALIAARDELRAIKDSLRGLVRGSRRWQNALIAASQPPAAYLGKILGYFASRRA
jgi:glycosyltransferase involved in cell wall biosynthesis